jgi:ABC-type branched-subunit amino acid transport system substrate-binding protein
MRKRVHACLYGTRPTRTAVVMICCVACVGFSSAFAQTAKTALRIGVVVPGGAATTTEISSLRGIRLGASEAKQTAQLFGDAVEIYEASGDGRARGALPAAAFLSSARKVQILIGIRAADAENLSRFAEDHDLLFLNIAARNAALRSACRRNSFHVEATDVMYATGRRLYAHDMNAHSTPSLGQADTVVLWDQGLERFGASQLNDRYRVAVGSGMDGSAWAGWAAVKIAAESALRARSTEPARLRAYLEAPTTQFDGHKGWPLSFRPLDHQLRQPLYMVVGRPPATRLVDIPDLRGISAASSDRAAIDALDQLSGGGARCTQTPGKG